jgi:hypothetical protein
MKLATIGLIALTAAVAPAMANEHAQQQSNLEEVTYLVLTGFSKRGYGDSISTTLIPMRNKEQCEETGKRIIDSNQLHTLRKGYECIDGLY